jgi:predicted amidohydrolase
MIWGQGDGSTLEALDSAVGTIGSLVCWEHWMPLARAVMHAQHEVLHIAPWPWVHDLHQMCSRHYAFEGQCFVAASGCHMTRGQMLEGFASVGGDAAAARELLESIPGDADTPMLRGGSALIGPDSQFVSDPVLDSAATVYGTVEPDRIEEGRMYLDTDGHYSRPDVFLLQVDTDARANVMVPDPHVGHQDEPAEHGEHDHADCGHPDHDHSEDPSHHHHGATCSDPGCDCHKA